MSEKIYCGNAKIITTKYGEIPKGSMHKDDINKAVAWMKANNSDWFNFSIMEKKEKVNGKPTHYILLDDWKPEAKAEPAPIPEQPPLPESEDDLPF